MKLSRATLLHASSGAVLGLFCWVGYRQLSVIDPFQAYGLSGLLVCAIAGALIYPTRARPVVWAIAAGLAFMLVVVSHTQIMQSATRGFIRRDSVSSVDAVVVLSSGVSDDELLDQQGTDRLLTGIQLVREGVARNLVLTSISAAGSTRTVYSAHDQRRIASLAGDSVNVFTTGFTANTHDEAVATRTIAAQRGWKRIALVTSPMHSRRACAAFEHAGLTVVCSPALARDLAINTLVRPSDRLRAFQLWLYESLAASEYKRRGWL